MFTVFKKINWDISPYLEKKMMLILFWAFASGIPILLITTTLSARLISAGVSLKYIGLFSFVTIQPSITNITMFPIDWLKTKHECDQRSYLLWEFGIFRCILNFFNGRFQINFFSNGRLFGWEVWVVIFFSDWKYFSIILYSLKYL